MGHSPVTDTPVRKVPPNKRRIQVAALLASGMSQADIATVFSVDRKTIQRDAELVKPDAQAAKTILDQAQSRLRELMPVETRIERLVETLDEAQEWKQPGIALQVLQRMDAIDGLVTDSERMRSKAAEPQAITPMFSLPAGATISVTVSTSTERDVIDVTPQVTSSETHKL